MQSGLNWLLDELAEVSIPTFASSEEAENIKSLFSAQDAPSAEQFDGTIGSCVLGLRKKREQYADFVAQGSHAGVVLHAMKLLNIHGIREHTETRIRHICSGVFGERAVVEEEKIWREVAAELIRLQSVTQISGRNRRSRRSPFAMTLISIVLSLTTHSRASYTI